MSNNKECIAIFVNWHYLTFLYQSSFFTSRKSKFLYQSKKQCNSLFFSSLIANMVTILINFQQKFALVGSVQHFAIKFLNQKDFSHA